MATNEFEPEILTRPARVVADERAPSPRKPQRSNVPHRFSELRARDC
jgi:hypothetical protein